MRYYYKVVSYNVYDGDTVHDVVIDLGFDIRVSKKVRLARVQTPEIRNKDLEEKRLGYAAKHYLTELLSAGELEVRTCGTGKYGRWIGEFYINGVSVSDMMVESGHAKVYEA